MMKEKTVPIELNIWQVMKLLSEEARNLASYGCYWSADSRKEIDRHIAKIAEYRKALDQFEAQ